jgi:hypothetical protein
MAPPASTGLRGEISVRAHLRPRPHGFAVACLAVRVAGRCDEQADRPHLFAPVNRPAANQPRDEDHGEDDRQGSQKNTTDHAHTAKSI